MLSIKAVLICVYFLFFSSEGILALDDDYYYYDSPLPVQLKLHREPADWQMARMKCHDEGSILAAPWSEDFWSFILRNVTQPEGLTIYAGIQEQFSEGIYKNINGKQILSRNVEDTLDLARCVIYHYNGTRDVVNCNRPFAYVCQAPVGESLSGCGEFDYELNNRTGSCYKFHDTCKTWDDAYKTCQDEGAYLTIINSDTEADLLKKMFEKHPWKQLKNTDPKTPFLSFAVGFYYWKETDTYMTIHGEPIEQTGYANWNKESKAAPRRIVSGGIMYNDGTLGDIDKSLRVPFICEKKPVLREN